MHDAHQFLETLATVLCVAAVTTVVFQRLRQPVVLGYLLAGMVVGPNIPVPLVADVRIVGALSELGVVLLMFSLGIEFSFKKLLAVGRSAALIGGAQCSLMIWLGYLLGQAFGWTSLASFYAGAAIAISSTTIIVKAFDERGIKAEFTQIVFGVLIVEDLIAILLITVLTPLSAGDDVSTEELAVTAGRLAGFLALLIIVGLLTVPRLMRAVVRIERPETTVVAGVGLAFGFALLATAFGYSAALGAFLAGSLVAESGVEKTVEHLVQPVRDIFAAVFFVSVGMLIDPAEIYEHWFAVLAFTSVVVVGKLSAVSVAAFLTGRSIRTSIQAGMSMAQIGEFSFIIAGLGMATGAASSLLYSIMVAVSGITTLLTPWLIQAAEPTAAFIDRKLPRPLQTFAALYGSWLEQSRRGAADAERARIRQRIRWLAVDAVVLATIVVAASVEMQRLKVWASQYLSLSPRLTTVVVIAAVAAASAPFWIGMIRVARYLGFELAARVFPPAAEKGVDLSAAPRRLLIVTLQLGIVALVGLPLVAVTQPFLPPFSGALFLALLLSFSAVSFWRGAANFQGHATAGAQLIAEALGRQVRESRAAVTTAPIDDVNRLVAGLGSPEPVRIDVRSPAAGKTLAELQLRGLTGATVLAIERRGTSILIPSGTERLQAGDVLAVAGTQEAVAAAKSLLAGENGELA